MDERLKEKIWNDLNDKWDSVLPQALFLYIKNIYPVGNQLDIEVMNLVKDYLRENDNNQL